MTKVKSVGVACPRCKGTGGVEVTGARRETYNFLKRLTKRKSSYVVANRDHDLFGCGPTALSNRLSWLENHGLATSEVFGREKRYRAV